MNELSPKLISKLKRLKLVASDLDGTLLNNEGKITDATRESVLRLKGLGVRFAIMTARAHSSAERIADELDASMPIISLDGGLVRLPHSQENIFASYIKPKVTKRVIAEVDKRFASITLFVDDKMVRRESETMLPSYIDSFELDTMELNDLNSVAHKAIQIIVGADSKHALTSIARKSFGMLSGVNSIIYKSSRHDERWYLDVKNKKHSKATGLVYLEKYLRIGKDRVAVLGDFQNDIEAFEHAGVGVAMKNAVWELKERSNMVTTRTNHEDGAAEFFDLIYELRTKNAS